MLSSWVRSMVTMKRRFRGLYHGRHIQFGNKKTFSAKKCAAVEDCS